jgi:hypothetical protein
MRWASGRGRPYYLMPMLDGWTEVFRFPQATTGTKAQTWHITGPGKANCPREWSSTNHQLPCLAWVQSIAPVPPRITRLSRHAG